MTNESLRLYGLTQREPLSSLDAHKADFLGVIDGEKQALQSF